MKKVFLALLVFGSLSTLAIPAHAGDNVNIQQQDQTAITTGNGNLSIQDHQQTIRDRRSNARDHSGNVQTGSQVTDTVGSGNATIQQGRQEINETSRNRPTSRR